MSSNLITIVKDFKTVGDQERDLQRKIIEVFDAHLSDRLVSNQRLKLIGEEVSVGYANLNDRKIDLLALNQNGQPVIIELKKAKDGNHELQALRYGLLLQMFTRADIDQIFLRFKQLLYQLEISDENPTPEMAVKELDDFIEGANFSEAKKDFSIVLIAEEFTSEVLYACKTLKELHVCHAHCIEIKHPVKDELVFKSVEYREIASGTKSKKPKTSNTVLSTEEILNAIDDIALRDIFRKLVNKHIDKWQPNNKRLSINGPKNSRGLQINWRLTQTTNRISLRQNNIMNGDADLDVLRSLKLLDVAYSNDEQNINAKIESASALESFISMHKLL